MAGINLGPDHDLAVRLQKMEDNIAALSTQGNYQELAARVTYSASNPTFSLVWTASTSVTDMGVTINFTLDRQRTVLALATTRFAATSYGLTQSGIVSILGNGTNVGGSNPGFTAPTVSGQSGIINLPITTASSFVLPAGATTVSMTGQGQFGSSPGGGSFNSANLVVMILGPA